MLIRIDDELEAQIAAICATGSLPQLKGVSNLLQSHADGRHIVVTTPSICQILEACTRLSEEHRATARRIRTRYHELARLQDLMLVFGELTLSGQEPIKSGQIWKIPLDWLSQNGLDATNLVCEDLYDCEISREAAEDFLSVNDLNGLSLGLEEIPGGGGNTHCVLKKRAIDSKKICICVVDSDRQDPGVSSPLGATASNCLQILEPGLYELLITDGRELENHIPARLLDKTRINWHGFPPAQTIVSMEGYYPKVGLFADLKSGIKKHDVDQMTGDTHSYWMGAMSALPHCSSTCCPGKCVEKCAGDCRKSVISPLGRTLLKDTGIYLKSPLKGASRKRHQQYLPSPNDGFWKKLGQLVAAYGISVKPSRGI